jgi:flagellar motor protein MotB
MINTIIEQLNNAGCKATMENVGSLRSQRDITELIKARTVQHNIIILKLQKIDIIGAVQEGCELDTIIALLQEAQECLQDKEQLELLLLDAYPEELHPLVVDAKKLLARQQHEEQQHEEQQEQHEQQHRQQKQQEQQQQEQEYEQEQGQHEQHEQECVPKKIKIAIKPREKK